MKHYRSLLLLPFVLTGCATTDMQGALDSLNGLGQSIGTSLSQAATPASAASRNSLLGTPLHNALRQNLSTDGRAPEWPKPEFDSSKAHFRPTPSNGAGFRAMGRQKPRYTGC